MITSPIMILLLIFGALFSVSAYALHIAQLCEDKVEGIVVTHRSTRSLLEQKNRAERTAAFAFAIGFILAAVIVGTIESQPLS